MNIGNNDLMAAEHYFFAFVLFWDGLVMYPRLALSSLYSWGWTWFMTLPLLTPECWVEGYMPPARLVWCWIKPRSSAWWASTVPTGLQSYSQHTYFNPFYLVDMIARMLRLNTSILNPWREEKESLTCNCLHKPLPESGRSSWICAGFVFKL